MRVIEITKEELLSDGDWECAFGEGDAYCKTTSVVESLDGTSTAPVSRADVDEVTAAVNGAPDDACWTGVFRLRDGRWLAVDAGCDFTGWD